MNSSTDSGSRARNRKGKRVDAQIVGVSRHGLVSRQQLLDLGLTADAIDWRIGAGRLLPLGCGVHAVGRPVVGEEAEWMGALLAAGPDAALAGRSAAAVWGIIEWKGTIEVVRTRARRRATFRLKRPGLVRTKWVHVRSSTWNGPADITGHRCLRVTSVPRTLLDLAGSLEEPRLRAAFNEADRKGLLKAHELNEFTDRSRGWGGAGRFREMVRTRQPEVAVSESELEAMFLRLCGEAGVRLPEPNQQVLDYRVDCLWREERLVVELDGYAFHRGRMAFEKDTARDNRLKRAGFQVLRFTYDMVARKGDEVVELVTHELEMRARLGGDESAPT